MRTKRLSLLFQLCFWSLLMALQMALAVNFLPSRVALIFAGANTIMSMTMFYVNSLWVFPAFFEKRRFVLYLLINILLVAALTQLFLMVDGVLVRSFRIEPPKHEIPVAFHYVRVITMLIFIFITSLTFSLIRKVAEQEHVQKQMAREKSETEIRLLKAQINPHFIFNSLNNIYSLSYSKSDDAPQAVLKLSEMLRYVYYDCNRDEVTLGAEIEYIRNYITFQQMKSPHEQQIHLRSEGIDEGVRIAPMLCIPFVENAFKYSKIEDEKDAWVDISLETGREGLSFLIRNSYPGGRQKSGSGLGIKNVRNRLELTYPNASHLEILDEKGVFEVFMTIRRG